MKKNILKKASVGMTLGIALGLTFLPFLALAAVDVTIPQTSRSAGDILVSVSNWASGIIVAVAIIMLLYAAFLFLAGGTSEDTMKKAKNTLIYAIVGIAVAILAYSVAPLVKGILGF